MVFNILFDIQKRNYMSVLPQASLFLGIIPALFIMYICLKGYDEHYKEKNIFLTFIAGIIMGFIAAFVQYAFYSFVFFSIIFLAIFDQLFKTIVLNINRLQQKRETPIYGLSLGLGFGSSFTPFMLIAASASKFIPNDTYVMTIIGLGSIGLILFHGATGIYIGYGIYDKTLTRNLIISIILQIPISLFVGFMLTYSNIESITYQVAFSTAAIIYGLIVFYYVYNKVLPNILRGRKVKKSEKEV